jgi:hypothetical protein
MDDGQGEPLPSAIGVRGEWIIKNVAFIYHEGDDASEPSPTFTRRAEREDGSYAMGFVAAQLAAAFGIETPSLMQANRNGLLTFVGDRSVAPSHGGISAVEYIFRIGGTHASLTTEIYQQEGRA